MTKATEAKKLEKTPSVYFVSDTSVGNVVSDVPGTIAGNGSSSPVAEQVSVILESDLEIIRVGPENFKPETLLRVYRTMLTSRRLDEKMLTLLKQGKGFFHIGCAGHEAMQAAAGLNMNAGHD